VFTVTRAGLPTTNALTVNYTLGGDATAGIDFVAPSPNANVTIPTGANSATVTITPLASTNVVNTKRVTLTVASGAGSGATNSYNIGTPSTATVTLSGNSVPAKSLQMISGSPRLTWNATVGKTYMVAYKNNLSDPSWTTVASGLNAISATLTWTDPTSSGQRQRFYLIGQTN